MTNYDKDVFEMYVYCIYNNLIFVASRDSYDWKAKEKKEYIINTW